MSAADTARLSALKDRLVKNEEDHVKLKDQIAKEEKRIRDKEKRDNERWWKELSKMMEGLFLSHIGPDYKEKIKKDAIADIVRDYMEQNPERYRLYITDGETLKTQEQYDPESDPDSETRHEASAY